MRVLDSYALIAYLEDEKGAAKVERLMKEAERKKELLLMSVVNWGEVYYITKREQGERKASEVLDLIDQLPLAIVDCARNVTRKAAELKSRHAVAYADCFAAALAIETGSSVLTGDPEFKKMEPEVSIDWL